MEINQQTDVINVPSTQVEMMRSMLDSEGWKESPLLPKGWRWREDKVLKNSREFMDSSGNFYRSLKQAEAQLNSSEQQLKNFRMFVAQSHQNIL